MSAGRARRTQRYFRTRPMEFHMKNRMYKFSVILTASLSLSTTAFAAGTTSTKDAPDLKSVHAKIDAKDFKAAIAELTPMLDATPNADVFNLMGFSLRKSGDVKQASTFYMKALDLDPNHKGALEYQGELYLQIGDVDHAKANLAKLATLCPQGCEERDELEKQVNAAAKTN
jgi:Flp pilus assembly protein TadD